MSKQGIPGIRSEGPWGLLYLPRGLTYREGVRECMCRREEVREGRKEGGREEEKQGPGQGETNTSWGR